MYNNNTITVNLLITAGCETISIWDGVVSEKKRTGRIEGDRGGIIRELQLKHINHQFFINETVFIRR